ncbi:MAG: HesA/MoeB/ThiF family protein [Sphingomicrobium sp.]
MSLSDAELERYARHIVLPQVGGVGQRKLKAARVAVVGAGGIGSAVIPALAGAGVGRLTIIDDDVVEMSNLQRQTIFRDDQVGVGKAEAAAAFASALNPSVEVTAAADRIGPANAEHLLAGHDLIIDGCDNFATRLAVNEGAVRLQTPLVSAAAAQFQGQIALLRGWQAEQPCYRCFVGDAFDAEACDTCAELGVLGALTGAVGHLAALLGIRALLGVGEESEGKLFLIDALSFSVRAIRIPKDPACATCGGGDAAGS